MFDNLPNLVHRDLHVFVLPDAHDPPSSIGESRVCQAVTLNIPP